MAVAFIKTSDAVCGKGAAVTLTGNVGVAWATATVVKTATAVLTKSDGYQIKIATATGTGVVGTGKVMGGCIQALATENLVCNTSETLTESSVVGTLKQKATWVAHATWKLVGGSALAQGGTAITVVDTSLVMVPNCTKTTFVAATDTGCLAATGSVADSIQSITYFQPKEDPKKVYTALPRYYKG